MLGDLGSASLAVGMLAATLAALLWLRAAVAGGDARLARAATTLTLLAAATACAILEAALLRHDFSVRFVAENGGRGVPAYYTVTSLWAALDGSLLLWLLIHGGYAALLARQAIRRPGPLHRYAMVVVSTVSVFFFALAYFAADPFRTVEPVPSTGPGPNPLLQQHPAMGLHPPLLYAGYIGLVVPFAFALAGLLSGREGRAWPAAARRWILFAWAMLTAGITMGAWWSYAVLGWGGYWAWDPVENASLLPWLTATALVHSTLDGRRSNDRAGWNVPLACASFVLVLLGTFLTRSGAVTSVHAFTESPLGPMLLGFVLLAVTTSAVLTGWRGQPPSRAAAAPGALSRAGAILINGVVLVTLASVVFIGTVFPLVSEALGGGRAAVGPAYYNRTAVPVAIALLALMGVAPVLSGGRRRPDQLAGELTVPLGAAFAVVAVVGMLSRPGLTALAAFGCATFVLAGIARLLGAQVRSALTAAGPVVPELVRRRAALAGLLAHAGIALVALGVAASSAYTGSSERQIRVGEAVTVGDVSARLLEIHRERGAADMTLAARLRLTDGRGTVRTIAPTLRYYPARDTMVSVPQISSGPLRDTYLTVVAVAPDAGAATVRLAVNPLVGLLWAGGALTALGGLLAASAKPAARRVTRLGGSPHVAGSVVAARSPAGDGDGT